MKHDADSPADLERNDAYIEWCEANDFDPDEHDPDEMDDEFDEPDYDDYSDYDYDRGSDAAYFGEGFW